MSNDNADKTPYVLIKPKRWFLFTVAGMIGFLIGAILLAALILMRTGQAPRSAWIIGNSMEPRLIGPTVLWTCEACQYRFRFGRESLNENQPLICPFCKTVSNAPTYQLLIDQKAEVDLPEQVQYYLRSYAAARRRKKSEHPTDNQGFLRGDLVVFNAPDLGRKEIKRIVSFPGEMLEIRSGDLWVDQQRWAKNSEELLLQSVLVADSSRSSISGAFWQADETRLSPPASAPPTLELGEEATELSFYAPHGVIDNQLVYNLHDSHAPVAVPDIGSAIQIGSTSSEWSVRWSIHSAGRSTTVHLTGNQTRWTGRFEEDEKQIDAPKLSGDDRTDWLIMAIVDGHAILAFNQQEIFRWNLSELVDAKSEVDGKEPTVRLECEAGWLQIHEWLVFRDIHYRGHQDSPSQMIQDSGFGLLGDNVSLSHDARQRWPDGIASEQMSGILESDQTGIENLLRQRHMLPQPSR